MASSNYLVGRKKYNLPQAMLWSDNPGSLAGDGFYYPDGTEIGANQTGINEALKNQFIILSDHNRSDLQFSNDRIETRQRMINGRMRSYHVADKINLSTSWSNLPSKAYTDNPSWDINTGKSVYDATTNVFTADGGAGGLEILSWYETHSKPFWVFLAYDRYANRIKYNQIIKMYFKDFSYNVVKRNGNLHDLWNINISLEEV